MTEENKLEWYIPVTMSFTRKDEATDVWDFTINRATADDNSVTIINVEDWPASQVFVRTGFKLPEPERDADDAIAAAKAVITKALEDLGTTSITKTSFVQDRLLDALNELGDKAVTPPQSEEIVEEVEEDDDEYEDDETEEPPELVGAH